MQDSKDSKRPVGAYLRSLLVFDSHPAVMEGLRRAADALDQTFPEIEMLRADNYEVRKIAEEAYARVDTLREAYKNLLTFVQGAFPNQSWASCEDVLRATETKETT